MHDSTTGDTAGASDPSDYTTLLESRVAVLESRLAAVFPGHDPDPCAVTTGELLRRRRRDLQQTQAVAALVMGVNQATVSKWERGDRIGWDHAADVAEYLGIAPVVLLAHSI